MIKEYCDICGKETVTDKYFLPVIKDSYARDRHGTPMVATKDINWNDFPTYQKRGSCCVRNHMISEPYGNRMLDKNACENEWVIDKNIPIFKGEGRKYIDDLVFVGE